MSNFEYRFKDDNQEIIRVNDLTFKVKPHWFWAEYRSIGWEPQTYKIFKKYLKPDKNYIDIGAWVGVTSFFAREIGVKNIYAVEANPMTYKLLSEMIEDNELLKNMHLSHLCITDKDGEKIGFGGHDNSENMSSASSIRGNVWQVPTSKLTSYIKNNNITDFNFIKIDIEGAENLLKDDLIELSKKEDLCVFLSLHPPFWKDKKEASKDILEACSCYNLYDANDDVLSIDKLEQMMLTDEEIPSWGTKFGNFFEILLKTK